MTTRRDRRPEIRYAFDAIDVCVMVLAFTLLFASFLASGLRSPVSVITSSSFFYGIRYDLVPLAAFIVLRRVPWSEPFLRRLPIVLGGVVVVTVAYALVTLVLPASFFAAIGYSDLHSLYVPGRAVAAFQQIGGTDIRRLQGAMSGPNQFGIWLACVLPFLLTLPARTRRIVAPLALLAIVLSFSRAAWIASAVIVAVHFFPVIRALSVRTLIVACVGLLMLTTGAFFAFPSVVLRIESSLDHLRNPIEAASIMLREPLGRGLGSAGPAHNRVSDACVLLEAGSDPSWAAAHPDLCVFVGGEQVQPSGRTCACPLLPENWYLQLGVEGGWVAMIAFIVLLFLLIRRLWPTPPTHAMLAVAIAGLFLHAWEDAAVAYTVWILAAVWLSVTSSTVPSSESELEDSLKV